MLHEVETKGKKIVEQTKIVSLRKRTVVITLNYPAVIRQQSQRLLTRKSAIRKLNLISQYL